MTPLIHHGNCLEWLAGFEAKSVDHVICDPPYDQRTSANARTIRGAIRNKRAVAEEGAGRERYIPFDGCTPSDFVAETLRVASRWVICFCALEQLGAYQAAAGSSWIRSGVWIRRGSAPQFTGDRPGQGAEGVAIMHRAGRKRWNRKGMPAVWDFMREATGIQPGAGERIHPTQKPVDLMIDVLEAFTDAGELVIDPFAGSGTTGVAALRRGRRFLGCEINTEYAARANERLQAEIEGSTIQAREAGQLALLGGRP